MWQQIKADLQMQRPSLSNILEGYQILVQCDGRDIQETEILVIFLNHSKHYTTEISIS